MKKVISENRKAFHEYFISDRYEAGLILQGTEIKSIRQGNVQLRDAYIVIIEKEAYIEGMNIATYKEGNRFNHEEKRRRKLLLHQHEINKIEKSMVLKGYTVVPLSLYLIKGRAKLEIGLAKGKKLHDKREVEKLRSIDREIEKAFKGNR